MPRKRILTRRSRRTFFCRNFGHKGSPEQSRTPLLMTIGLILAILLFIYPLGADSFLIPGNFKTIIAERVFSLDYFTLISNSLPGLAPQGEAGILSEKEEGAHFQSPLWQDYPQMLLSNELAGLQVLEASKLILPSAVGEDSSTPGQEPNEGEESAVFLTGKKTEPTREKPFTLEDDKPLLLIYHTHTSESFFLFPGKLMPPIRGRPLSSLVRLWLKHCRRIMVSLFCIIRRYLINPGVMLIKKPARLSKKYCSRTRKSRWCWICTAMVFLEKLQQQIFQDKILPGFFL